ncbi:MAG: C39 family peptidase [bacterium]|nr:C39 family peptidase [bacterium]MCM1375599.1 C39 family peptidase [Muribaculum sp.]
MQEKRVSRKSEKKTIIGLAVVGVCIVLCVIHIIQTMQLQAQLREQEEQMLHTYNMVQLLYNEMQDSGDNLETLRGVGEESRGELKPVDAQPRAVQVEEMVSQPQSYAEQCGLDYVDKPQERSPLQVLERLEELGIWDTRIAEIFQNSKVYPERLLEALANNPEMADFVEGYPESKHKAVGGLTDSEKQERYPLFLQWDPRWGYASYGDNSCIALSGCGPTCLSMVLYYLTGDESLTPDVIGEYSMQNGYYLSGTGTLWALFEDTVPKYGVKVGQPDASEWEMKEALDQGAVLVCSMGPGDFTVGGHFIVVYGYDENGFLINDPNCVARSRQTWTYDQIDRQIKHLWVFEG